MRKTKIDWADSTWNPVTGCLHGCEYCYARRISERFRTKCTADTMFVPNTILPQSEGRIHLLEGPINMIMRDDSKPGWHDWDNPKYQAYPFGFEPTFHRYRLNEPAKWTKPSTIFVCSMADLFGEWVPDEWIEDVLAACEKAPQHRYLFLTKNPERYLELADGGKLPVGDGFWYGTTVTGPDDAYFYAAHSKKIHTFLSVEPLLHPFTYSPIPEKTLPHWVIIGAETGNRKDKVVPQRDWIEQICRIATPIFMKESLRDIMGDDFIQEYPWEVRNGA